MAVEKTTIENHVLDNENLGSLVRVPIPEDHDQYPKLTSSDIQSGDTINVIAANFVFFKPKQYSLITGFTRWFSVEHMGKDPYTNEHYRDSPVNVSYNVVEPATGHFTTAGDTINPNGDIWEKHPDLIGSLYIGLEYNYTKTYENLAGYNSGISTTYHIQVLGGENYSKMPIIGPDDYSHLCYTYRTSDTYQTTYGIIPHYGEEHTYTNIVAFAGEYETDGFVYKDQYTIGAQPSDEGYGELPPIYQAYISQYSIKDAFGNSAYIYDRDGNMESEINLGQSATTSSGLFYEFSSNPQTTPKVTILVYMDCYLCIFSPVYLGYKAVGTKTDNGDGTYAIKKTGYQLILKSKSDELSNVGSEEDPTAYLIHQNANYYQSIFDYEKYEPQTHVDTLDSNSRLNNMVQDECYGIDYFNRWVRAFEICYHRNSYPMRISGFYNIVGLVVKDDINKINEEVKCTCKRHRFTEYWCMSKNCFAVSGEFQVLHESDAFPTDTLCNRVAYPILKPWAAVELVVFNDNANDDGGGNFGKHTPMNNDEYKCLHKIAEKNYGKYLISLVFDATEMEYSINESDDIDEKAKKVVRHFADYYKTKGPFRIEHYICHGSREEYDPNKNGSGRCGLIVTENFGFGHNTLNKLHEKLPSNSKLVQFCQSCYSSGVNYPISRSPNSHIYQSEISGMNNSCGWFSACGTHCGYGGQDAEDDDIGLQLSFPILNTAIKICENQNTMTYSAVNKFHNDIAMNLERKTFKKILDFYINNYDSMKIAVDENYQSWWDNTKDYILQDMQNNGMTYFCREDWEKKRHQFQLCDNYIAYEKYGKIYPIYDGFIGYIEHAIQDYLASAGNRLAWPSSFNIDAYITRQYIKFFTDHGYNMWYFRGNPARLAELGPTDTSANANVIEMDIDIKINDFTEQNNIDNRLDQMKDEDVEALYDLSQIEEKLKELYAEMKTKRKKLVNSIIQDYTNLGMSKYSVIASFVKPRMHVSGLFAQPNAEFLRNPDKEEDAFLSSDADLEELRNTTKNNS